MWQEKGENGEREPTHDTKKRNGKKKGNTEEIHPDRNTGNLSGQGGGLGQSKDEGETKSKKWRGG